ncbi:TetR/AcrR family transcriptional regulator [Clostridium beijerinckii]|uniref:TetR/AcrR family transcriptional regulator n=1 Tax=Clostridium beijerinckii TaxID=1520 RepID=UPI00098BD2FF|nr:TetR/AcrR family transcriptional regulator [Clostridium beijerinckii]NRT79827.1 AcrR family transcriptional regulator [Clostridium beijerinckii]OOM46868.1 bacterial regulatory protein, tetR family [Clostridium beijerinckii]
MIQKSQINDKRITKSRKLIQDSFLSLANKSPFENITVKDISERANVNRATFYAHFKDKYDLLDSFISDEFMTIVSSRISPDAKLNEKTLRDLIFIMCDYHKTVGTSYIRLYKSANMLIDMRVQLKLQDIVQNMLNNTRACSKNEDEKLELITVMMSSGIYCATKRWHSKGNLKDASAVSALADEILSFMTSWLTSALD